MSISAARSELATHTVENQPVPRGDRRLWQGDPVLRHWLTVAGGDGQIIQSAAAAFGAPEIVEAAEEARRDPPRLVSFNRDGRRLDEVRFNAGYHRVMQVGLGQGYAALAWPDQSAGADKPAGANKADGQVNHAALVYMMSQIEPGACCPMTMTYAAIPALKANPKLAAQWLPKLTSGIYDRRIAPIDQKRGATLGMAMTEKQGGSDVRANTTKAVADGDQYRLYGHKWFCSAPMSDGFLTLAQAPGGLTCFLVPRWLPEGRNAIELMRLKSKLGNVANASSEIEYHGALAHRLGGEGDGVRTIIEMVHHTRLDTAIAPAGLMRAALAEAHWWVSGRSAFQRRLIDQPLMRSVLADLVLDWESAVALGMTAAQAFDGTSEDDRIFARISVALAKFLSNKRCPVVLAEAMEVLGGMGYVEETPMPMLYREAPLNGIWEGSGNVICLDILRTLARQPGSVEVLAERLAAAKGADRRYDAALAAHQARWPGIPPEAEARWFAESLAMLLAASALLQNGVGAVSDGYIASRLDGQRGHVIGAVSGLDEVALLARLDG